MNGHWEGDNRAKIQGHGEEIHRHPEEHAREREAPPQTPRGVPSMPEEGWAETSDWLYYQFQHMCVCVSVCVVDR